MTDERPSRRALPQRYTSLAPFYDLLSAEWPVYRVGREIGIPRLGLGPGSHALDVGCGTGLNLPLLQDAVGPGGLVTGLEASPWTALERDCVDVSSESARGGHIQVRARDVARTARLSAPPRVPQ